MGPWGPDSVEEIVGSQLQLSLALGCFPELGFHSEDIELQLPSGPLPDRLQTLRLTCPDMPPPHIAPPFPLAVNGITVSLVFQGRNLSISL